MARLYTPLQRAEADRKRHEQQRLRQRQTAERKTRLAATDIARFLRQVDLLRRQQREEGHAPGARARALRLDRLEGDLRFMQLEGMFAAAIAEWQARAASGGGAAETAALGKRSVFYNPELNPLGAVPPGHGLVNLRQPVAALHPLYAPLPEPLAEVRLLPLPAGPPPQFYKIDARWSGGQVEEYTGGGSGQGL